MRKGLTSGLLTAGIAALAGLAGPVTQAPQGYVANPGSAVTFGPAVQTARAGRSVQETPAPLTVPTMQAIDLAFTGRGLRHYSRMHEPIWIGHPRPRRHWGGGSWRVG